MSRLRTFVAIETSQEVRGHAAKLIERLRGAEAKVKWVAPENMHLTLKFLGDVPAENINNVCRAVQEAADLHGPFPVDCQGAGAFPDAKRPRTIWMGVREPLEAIRALQTSVDQQLQKLGQPFRVCQE